DYSIPFGDFNHFVHQALSADSAVPSATYLGTERVDAWLHGQLSVGDGRLLSYKYTTFTTNRVEWFGLRDWAGICHKEKGLSHRVILLECVFHIPIQCCGIYTK